MKIALGLANAFIEVARSIKPLIPLIAALGALSLGRLASSAIGSGISGSGGAGGLGKGFNKGGKVLGFNRGGTVPGTGSGDTVPAMLEPGEFVIRKSAVQAFGSDRLSGINKYNGGTGKKGVTKAKQDSGKALNRSRRTSLRGINKQKIDYTQVDGIDSGELDNLGKGALKGVLFERFIARRLKKKTALGAIDFPTATQEDAEGLNATFGDSEFKGMLGIEATYNKTNAAKKRLGKAVAVYGEEFAKGGKATREYGGINLTGSGSSVVAKYGDGPATGEVNAVPSASNPSLL